MPGSIGILTWVETNLTSYQHYRVKVGDGPPIVTRNAVGAIRISCPRAQTVLAGMPYLSVDLRRYLARDVFGDQLPQGATVSTWDTYRGCFITDTNTADGWTGRIVFDQGRAFEVYVPPSAPLSNYVVYLMGELPSEYGGYEITITHTGSPALVAYPFPMDILWTNTALSQDASVGATQYYWETPGGYTVNVKTLSGWSCPNLIVRAGSAFWFTEGMNWTESKPYSWP